MGKEMAPVFINLALLGIGTGIVLRGVSRKFNRKNGV
jgi:cation transporter-like permease